MIGLNCVLMLTVRQPQHCLSLNDAQLEQLLNQARASNTLAMLAHRLDNNELLEQLPAWFVRHLHSAMQTAAAVHRSVRWEVFNIMRALRNIDTPVLFLKGAAYLLAHNSAAPGRVFSDVDFLVPKQRIAEVEKALLSYGWVQGNISRYDERYYRQWMHEVPPLKHIKRKSTLDVHHAILPLTTKARPNTDLLIRDAELLTCEFVDSEIYVLSPIDMILHSATHLFYDGELEHGFRDMMDIVSLSQQYCDSDESARQLLARAKQLQVEKPLFYALRYSAKMFNCALPQPLNAFSLQNRDRVLAPHWLAVMDWLFVRALCPKHKGCAQIGSALARWLLYIRAHYLRMPLYLLLPHLARKALFSKQAQTT